MLAILARKRHLLHCKISCCRTISFHINFVSVNPSITQWVIFAVLLRFKHAHVVQTGLRTIGLGQCIEIKRQLKLIPNREQNE